MGSLLAIPLEYVTSRVMGHTIVTDLSADRSGSCSMFVEMSNLATKPSSLDDGLVARFAISAAFALLIHPWVITLDVQDNGNPVPVELFIQ